MSVKAVFLYPKCGTEFDQERVQSCGLEVKREYEVSHFVMGQSSTSVYLEGYTLPFNSIHFEFLEDGKPLDIFWGRSFLQVLELGRPLCKTEKSVPLPGVEPSCHNGKRSPQSAYYE